MTDPQDEPLTPMERLFVRLRLEHHEDEAKALMLTDALMRGILATDEPLTADAEELRGELLEVLESWLPKHLVIVDA